MGRYKELASNTTIFAISNIISKVILSLLLPIYTRVLTTEEYGTAELLTTISSLVVPVFSIAIQDSMFRFGLKDESTAKKALSNTIKVEVVSSIILLFFSFGLRFYTPLSNYGIYFSAISISTMFRSTLSLYTKTVNKTKVFAIDNILYNLLLALLNIFLLCVIGLKIDGYFWAIIVSNFFSIVFLSIKSDAVNVLRNNVTDKELLREMVKYSAPLIINSISWGLTHVVDKMMLTSMEEVSATGIYTAASKIPSLLSLVTGVFSQAWTISAIKSMDQNDDSGFLNNIFKLYHFFLVVTSVLILAINNNLMVIILGSEFAESSKYIPSLLIGAVFLAYSNFYSPIFAGLKKSEVIMMSALGGAILNIILNYFMIPVYGIIGACFATMVSYIFIGVFRMIVCQKKKPLQLQLPRIIVSLGLLAIEGVLVYLQKDHIVISIAVLILISLVYLSDLKDWLIKLDGLVKNGRKK